MGQTFRLSVLVACCLILIQGYQFVYFLTEIPQYCWELHDVWLSGGFLESPFWTFSIVFGLLAAWVFVEWWALLKSGVFAAHRVGVLVSALPLIIFLGVMQFVMWQSLQIKAGSLQVEDAWLPHYEKSTLQQMQESRLRRQQARDQWRADYPDVPYDFDEFIVAHSCDIGIERTNLTTKQWERLFDEFDVIKYRHYKGLERERVSNNRAGRFGLTDEE